MINQFPIKLLILFFNIAVGGGLEETTTKLVTDPVRGQPVEILGNILKLFSFFNKKNQETFPIVKKYK